MMALLTKILTAIATLGPKIPEAVKLIELLINLFSSDIEAALPEGGLQMTELPAEAMVAVDTITAAIAEPGTQAVFDLERVRKLAAWLNKIASSPLGSALITLLTHTRA